MMSCADPARKKLSELAKVRSGLVLARKAANYSEKITEYNILTLRAINKDGSLNLSEMDTFGANNKLSQNYLTKAGDIVMRLSAPFTAVLIDKNTEGLLVSSNFVIIRAKDACIMSEFLAYILNSEKVRQIITLNSFGSMIKSVSPKFLADIEIPVPSLHKQRLINTINALANKELIILDKLRLNKEIFYNEIIKRNI